MFYLVENNNGTADGGCIRFKNPPGAHKTDNNLDTTGALTIRTMWVMDTKLCVSLIYFHVRSIS